MDSFIKHECKLCDNIISDECFDVIEDLTKNIFDVLLLKWTSDNETQNVICKMCSSNLLAAFNFKLTCLDRDKSIIRYLDLKNLKPVDLKEIYAQEKGSKQGDSMLEDREICRLCLQPMGGDYKSVQEVPVDSIQIYIPEINFAVTKNPVICITCHDALCVHSTFIRNCLETEKQRNVVRHILLTNPPVKIEEIEIKPEPIDDETLFQITHDLENDKYEEGDTSLHSQNDLRGTEETKYQYDLDNLKQTTSDTHFMDSESSHKRDSEVSKTGKNKLKLVKKGIKLQKHQRGKRTVIMYECDECDYKSTRKGRFEQHQLTHKDLSEVQRYACDRCKFVSKYKRSLENHCLSHKDPSERTIYECDKCEYKGFKKGHFQSHQLRHKDPSEVRMFTCDRCKYTTKYKRSLAQHQLTHEDPAEVQTYACEECDYKGLLKAHLKTHMLTHKDPSEVQMYRCETCEFTTKHKWYLMKHGMRHKDASEVPVHECGECDYKTNRKNSLTKHQLTHKDPSEVQTYACDKCKFTTKYKESLVKHCLRHKDPSEVEMYECSECDYRSFIKHCLTIHQLRHRDVSEVQMYTCDLCDYKTVQKALLKKHQLTHKDPSEVQMHTCEKCKFTTKYKSNLAQHCLRHKDAPEVQMYEGNESEYRTIIKDEPSVD